MRKLQIITAFAVLASCGLCSCNEYIDDVQGLGKRVEVLEDSVLSIQNTLATIQKLQVAMDTYGVVSNIITNKDGSTTIEFLDGREPITFVNGENGKTGKILLSVEQDEDGHYYWTFGGGWLLDENGNKISAEPKDGQDGKDGQNGKDAEPAAGDIILPQARINPTTRVWEISEDGGKTWHSTGISADGKDGKDGEDGVDGSPDPIIIGVSYTNDFIFFRILINGQIQTIRLRLVD